MYENGEEGEFESYESVTTLAEAEEDRKLDELTVSDTKSLERITKELVQETQRELGLIKLCWPEVDPRKDLYLKTLPSDYCIVNGKEKVLAWYAENFRRQFHVKYPKRKQLLLMCENECGVQKFVSTTIRPSTLPYPELYTWQGCGKFVSDYIEYVPLDKALSMVSSRTYHSSNNVLFRKAKRRRSLNIYNIIYIYVYIYIISHRYNKHRASSLSNFFFFFCSSFGPFSFARVACTHSHTHKRSFNLTLFTIRK
ncbi:dynein regulatory complex subunit 7-like [Colletes gigas]|uniref:dynein regulatory complex subunit 7-like n=1 Tax=Colletes gigas TaxID=935657 RepID=UPI001C9A9FB2|nr:dynein regulatory complex subunit 7-like [Colletes gigas]